MLTSSSSVLLQHMSIEMRALILSLGYFLYPLFMFFGASCLGDLSDCFGRKKVLVFCMGLLTFSFLLMACGIYFKRLLVFMVGRALSGLMAGAQPIAQATVADFSHSSNKARYMAILTFGNSLAFVIGPFAGGFFSNHAIVSFFDFWTPFVFAALLGFITFVWIALGFKESHRVKIQKKIRWNEPLIVFKKAFQHESLRLLCPMMIMMQVGVAMYLQYSIVFLGENYQYNSYQMGLFNAYIGVMVSVSSLVIVPILIKYFILERLASVALLISAIAFLVTVIYPSEFCIWIMVVPFALAVNVAFSMIMTTFSNQVSQDQQGWVMGIFGSSIAIAFAIGGATANLLPYWHARGLMIFGVVCFFICTAMMHYFNGRHRLHGPHGPVDPK